MKTRFWAILTALCILVCLPGVSLADLNAPGTLPIVTEPVTLTVGMPNPTAVEDVETNYATQMLEQATGIQLDFELFPATEAAQKLEIMISAGEKLPDMLWAFTLSDVAIYKYGVNGYFVDLNPYYESQSYYIKQVFEDPSNAYDMRKVLTSADGGMYSVGRLQEETHCEYAFKMLLNNAWIQKLGLKEPTTTDELYDVLKAFKENDPNGNGVADEIPLAGGTGWNQNPCNFIMNSFVYSNPGVDYLTVEDGKIAAAYNTDAWREGLRYLNKLTSEGLMSPLSFTQDNNQLQQMIQNPDIDILGGFTCGGVGGLLANYPKMNDYMLVGPMAGPEGVQLCPYSLSLPVPQGHITIDCENPEIAYQLMDYMWSYDASTTGRYGEKGVDWREAQEGDVAFLANIGREPARTTLLDLGTLQNKWWNFQCPMALRYSIVDGQIDAGVELDPWRVLYSGLYKMIGHRPDEVVVKIVYSEDQIDRIADTRSTIKSYVVESMTRFALGDLDVEKDWDAYINELNAMGLEDYLAVTQEAYDAFKIEVK